LRRGSWRRNNSYYKDYYDDDCGIFNRGRCHISLLGVGKDFDWTFVVDINTGLLLGYTIEKVEYMLDRLGPTMELLFG
jgi:hypothetical protein